jgi:HTH-type transcriptional regulator/antitoxin HigA
VARRLPVSTFDPDGLTRLVGSLPPRIRRPDDLDHLPEDFAAVGVKLLHVRPFAGGRIHGVATDVDGSPVIALSGHGARLDKVFFTLLHEAAHVSLGHVAGGRVLDADESADANGIEGQADALAREWAIPGGLPAPNGLVTGPRVEAMAAASGVSDWLVIGRLQNDGLIPWNSTLNKRIPLAKEALSRWP